jgi:anti-sigma factor (TIGR02949 family)
MNCADWQNRVEAYVDAELSPQERESFLAHAAQCRECATATLALAEAKRAVRRAGQRYSAPEALRARVLESMHPKHDVRVNRLQPDTRNVLQWPRWAMAAAAMALLALGLFWFGSRYQKANSLGEFADLHVANLASANPVEVVSSDKHTVKPWFQGRVPFTFDLPELQGSPFTLTGGRVTYFHQEPGAHLIFAYQRHNISAFIFRDTPQLAISQTSFADRSTSFNLETWTQGGLRYVLVSDVNAETLSELAGLLQRR